VGGGDGPRGITEVQGGIPAKLLERSRKRKPRWPGGAAATAAAGGGGGVAAADRGGGRPHEEQEDRWSANSGC